MSGAVAAAAIVAMIVSPSLPVPASLNELWLEARRSMPLDQLRGQALQVLTRAFGSPDNEWYELWADAELIDEVRRKASAAVYVVDTVRTRPVPTGGHT